MTTTGQCILKSLKIGRREGGDFTLTLQTVNGGSVEVFPDLESLSASLKESIENLFPSELPSVNTAKGAECLDMLVIARRLKFGHILEKEAFLNFWKRAD